MTLKKLSVAVAMIMAGQAQAAQGPSSSATPYVTPTAAGISVTSILTVGDAAANGYKMVGIPDGLGAYDNGDGTFTVLMNHELGSTEGISRAHGSKGAFVSQWVINKSTLAVISGQDMIQSAANVFTGGAGGVWTAGTTSFGRLCSADLPALPAFYNANSGKGYNGRIFMNGEESGNEGRAFGFVATGTGANTVYELPYLGKFSWENSVANPYVGDKTVVIGLDDSTPGQVYVYSGTKQISGNAVEMAGLNNGTLKGIKVNTANAQGGASGNLEQGQISGGFTTVLVDTSVNGATQQANARAAGVTEFARPEDGHWADAKTFYFVTTGADPDGAGPIGTQSARLYKISFNEVAGVVDYDNGTVSMVTDATSLTGTDGATARSFDNMFVNGNTILIQEDPGNSQYNAKTWMSSDGGATWTQILMSDVSRFGNSDGAILATAPFNKDEENSGIIEITDILGKNDGKRYFLADMQAHYGITGELVQGGQLYLVSAPVPEPETYAMMLAGLGMVGFMAKGRNAK